MVVAEAPAGVLAAAAGTTHVEVIFPPPAISLLLRKVGTMERMELEREADNAVADGMVFGVGVLVARFVLPFLVHLPLTFRSD